MKNSPIFINIKKVINSPIFDKETKETKKLLTDTYQYLKSEKHTDIWKRNKRNKEATHRYDKILFPNTFQKITKEKHYKNIIKVIKFLQEKRRYLSTSKTHRYDKILPPNQCFYTRTQPHCLQKCTHPENFILKRNMFRCLLPKAMSISRSEVFRKKIKETRKWKKLWEVNGRS